MKYFSIVILLLVLFNTQAKIFKAHKIDQPPPDTNKPNQQQPIKAQNTPNVPTIPKVQSTPEKVQLTPTLAASNNQKQPQQQLISPQNSISNTEGGGKIALVQKDGNYLMPIQIQGKNYTSLLSMQENISWIFVDKGKFCKNDQCQQVSSDLKCSTYTDKKINDNKAIQSSRTGKIEYSVNLDQSKRDLQTEIWVASKFSTNLPLSSSIVMLNINDWNNFSISSKGEQLIAAVGAQKPNQMIRFDQATNQKEQNIPNTKTQNNKNVQGNNKDKEQQNQDQDGQDKQDQQDNQDNQNNQNQQDQDQEDQNNQQQQTKPTQPSNNFIYLSINQVKIKQAASNIPFKFAFYVPSQGQNILFYLPQQYANLLKQSILKEYFSSQCKEKTTNKIICKKNTEPTDKPFMICKGSSKCIQLGLSDLVYKVKKTYSFAFTGQNAQQITFFPNFVKKYYDLYFDKGSFIGASKNSQYKLPDFIENDLNAEDTIDDQTDQINPQVAPNSSGQQMSWQKKGIIASIATYGVLGFLCIAIIKSKVSSSFVSSTLDSGFSIFTNYFHKSRGYEPSNFTQQIDDSHSVTIGYNQERNRQLFWQKNSVQGI